MQFENFITILFQSFWEFLAKIRPFSGWPLYSILWEVRRGRESESALTRALKCGRHSSAGAPHGDVMLQDSWRRIEQHGSERARGRAKSTSSVRTKSRRLFLQISCTRPVTADQGGYRPGTTPRAPNAPSGCLLETAHVWTASRYCVCSTMDVRKLHL